MEEEVVVLFEGCLEEKIWRYYGVVVLCMF